MKEQIRRQKWYSVIKIEIVYNKQIDKWEQVIIISNFNLWFYNLKILIKQLIIGKDNYYNRLHEKLKGVTIKKRPELNYKVL